MINFIIKRLLFAVPIFIGITIMVFILSNLAPGSPADVLAEAGELTEEGYEALKISLGLDQPIYVRYVYWLSDMLQGDLGTSTAINAPVSYLISIRIGPSLLLTGTAIFFAIMIGIPMGALAAYKPYSIWDDLSSAISFLGVSLPSFFVCLTLIYIFAVKFNILPAQGMHSPNDTSLLDLVRHLILPSSIICILTMGTFVKQTRGSMLEVLNEEYVKTARSKGISECAVIVKHVLRNSLIPIVTAIGLTIPLLVGGAVVTEQIFSWPGIGSLMIHAITTRDYNTIMGVTVLVSVAVLTVNILLDILYTYLDPRINR